MLNTDFDNRCVKLKNLWDFTHRFLNFKTKEELRELCWNSTPIVFEIG